MNTVPALAGPNRRAARLNSAVPEIMGAAEVAAELGVEVSNLDKQVGLPPPFTRLKATRLWRADLIREYARLRSIRRSG